MRDAYDDFDPKHCLNCGAEHGAGVSYCPRCSQANRPPARSVADWGVELSSSLFNLEGKTWSSLRDLFVPGRYARNYIAGQRQRYVHPARLLLFSSLVFFAAVSLERSDDLHLFNIDTSADAVGDENSDPPGEAVPASFLQGLSLAHTLDSLRQRLDSLQAVAEGNADEQTVAALEETREQVDQAEEIVDGITETAADTGVLAQMRYIDVLRMDVATHDRVARLRDTLLADGVASSPEATAVLDRFTAEFALHERSLDAIDESNGMNVLLYGERLHFPIRTLAAGSPQEVVDAAGLQHWANRLIVRKGAALVQGGTTALKSTCGPTSAGPSCCSSRCWPSGTASSTGAGCRTTYTT